jgi:hypothetical protein
MKNRARHNFYRHAKKYKCPVVLWDSEWVIVGTEEKILRPTNLTVDPFDKNPYNTTNDHNKEKIDND